VMHMPGQHIDILQYADLAYASQNRYDREARSGYIAYRES
jgi:hypothetical protein